jgi:hypothetical protein
MRFLLLLLVAQALPACCIWDRDTLASEAKGLDAVADAMTGMVDRYPPKFYEMRMERISVLLEKTPFDFPVYDDAAAALDRLGAYDAALIWMEKKRRAIERFSNGEGPPDSRYRDPKVLAEQNHRRLINSASIKLHKWLAQGAQREKMDDVTEARTLIIEARKINDSYGPERYLLIVTDWIIAGPQPAKDRMLPEPLGLVLANKTARGPNDTLKEKNYTDCFDGLAGLIRSSELWENVDMYYWLSLAFAVDGKQSLSYMARLRAFELIDAGKGSMVKGAPTGAQLKALIIPRMMEAGRLIEVKALSDRAREDIEDEFGRRRRFAQRVKEARWDFMDAKFTFGSHPDLDPLFWSGYEPPSMLKRDLPIDKPEKQPEPPPANLPRNAPPYVMEEAPGKSDEDSTSSMVVFVMVGAGTVLLVSLALWAAMKRRPTA